MPYLMGVVHGPREQSALSSWWKRARGVALSRVATAMGFLFILPAMVLYITFSAYPLVRGFMIAFSDYRYLIPDHQPFNGLITSLRWSTTRSFGNRLAARSTTPQSTPR